MAAIAARSPRARPGRLRSISSSRVRIGSIGRGPQVPAQGRGVAVDPDQRAQGHGHPLVEQDLEPEERVLPERAIPAARNPPRRRTASARAPGWCRGSGRPGGGPRRSGRSGPRRWTPSVSPRRRQRGSVERSPRLVDVARGRGGNAGPVGLQDPRVVSRKPGSHSSSASRKATNSPAASASPRFLAAPGARVLLDDQAEPGVVVPGDDRPAASVEPSSTTITSKSPTVCAGPSRAPGGCTGPCCTAG